MALPLDGLAMRLSNQLVAALEERDVLRTQIRMVSTQASTAQADNVSLSQRLFRNASNSVRYESELRAATNENQRLAEKLRAAAISAHALRIAVSPKGRLASLFDRMFEQLDSVETRRDSQQGLDTDTSPPIKRESRRRKRESSLSPSSETK
jgi:hypothetical protein